MDLSQAYGRLSHEISLLASRVRDGDREAAKRKMQEERAAAPPPNVARKPALPDLFVQRLKEKGIE